MATTRDKILATAQRHIDKGNLARAIKEYGKLLDLQPDDTRTRLRVGDLQARLGKGKDAITTYEQVAHEYSEQGFFLKAVAVLKQILRLDPARSDVQIHLAELYLKLNLLSDAMAQYRKVADRFRQQGDIDRYLEVLRRMADLDPEDVRTQITLAEHFSGEGRLEEAAEHFAAAADGLREQERWDEYVKVAERYIFHRQEDVERIIHLVYVYLDQRDFKRALAKLQLVFKSAPKDIEALKLLVACFLGLRKRDKAVRVLKELAETYTGEGQEELAIETYQRVLQLEPNDIDARTQLGLSVPSDISFDEVPETEEDPLATSNLPFEGSQPIRINDIRDNGPDQWRRLKAASGLFTTPSGLTTCNTQVTDEDLDEISRLLVEIDGFEKLGLIERSRAALKRVFELDPLNISAMERAVRIDLARGNIEGAIQRLLRMTRLCWRPDPVRAAGYLHDALQIDPSHASGQALRAELGLDGIDLETFMLESADESEVEIIEVDEGDFVESEMVEALSDSDLEFEADTFDPAANLISPLAEPEALDEEPWDEAEPSDEVEPDLERDYPAPYDTVPVVSDLDDDLFLEPDEPLDDLSDTHVGPAPQQPNPNVERGPGFHETATGRFEPGDADAQSGLELPPLPDDIPDDVLDELEQLDFLMTAGLRDEAQTLLFDLTTMHPEHTVLIMERMKQLEERAAGG